MFFSTYNIQFEVLANENYTKIKGEMTNDTTFNYTTALFKIFVYSKEVTMCKGTIKVHDLRAGAIKYFEAVLEMHRSRIPAISGYEIVFEQGY